MARATVLQWMAARGLCEGAPTTRGRVAALMSLDVSAVYARAAAEGWQCIDWRLARVQALQREIIAVNAAEREFYEGAWPAGAAMAGQGAAEAMPPGEAAVAGTATPDAPGATTGAGVAAAPDASGGVDGSGGTDGGDGADGIDPVDRDLDGAAFVAQAMAARRPPAPGLPPLDGADPVAVLAGASAFVARQVAALIDRAERAGGRLDRKQIDGLSAFARMMERWETLARERAQQEEVARDEDVAESLRLIDERILELAVVEARRMVAAGIVAPDA